MSDREEKKKKGPFGVDEVRLELKNVRQAVKNRWLVCYDDSEVGNRNPKTNNATAATDFAGLGTPATALGFGDFFFFLVPLRPPAAPARKLPEATA